ncbi:PH domain-containing protein [Lacticaseibacillus saniviri]
MSRLHLLSIPVFMDRFLRQVGIVALVGVVNSVIRGGWLVGFLTVVGILALAAIVALWRWLFFRYGITNGVLTIQNGLIAKKVTHIPLANIQTIQQKQWFFFKPFHVVELSIETSGHDSGRPEAMLPAVDENVLAALKQTDTVAAATPELAYTISSSDLNQYAWTSLGVIPILLGALWLFGRLDDLLPKAWIRQAQNQLLTLGIFLIVGLVMLFLILGLVVSYLNQLQKYYRFSLSVQSGKLVTERGFFQRNQVSVAPARIQALRFNQNIIRQWLHLFTVQALTASKAADDQANSDLVMIPVLKENRLLQTVQPFVNWSPVAYPEATKVPSSTYWRYSRNMMLGNGVFVAIVLFIVRQWTSPLWWSLAAIWLLIVALQGLYAARQGEIGFNQQLLVAQVGHAFGRSRYVVPRNKVQSLVLQQPILLRHTLVHVVINVRHGNSNQEITIKYLPKSVGKLVWQWYAPSLPNPMVD